MEDPASRHRPNKTLVIVATTCVGIGWTILVLTLLLVIGVTIGLAAGMPSKTPISTTGIAIILGASGVLITSAIIYAVLALRLRCPHCDFLFLKNPKGFGPVGFVYHPNCPRIAGCNPWGYQVGRFLGTRRMRCIQCGAEIFEDLPDEQRH